MAIHFSWWPVSIAKDDGEFGTLQVRCSELCRVRSKEQHQSLRR
jgi:hypothetical protein